MMKPSWYSEGAGWAGVALVLAAYALLTFGFVRADAWPYHALNGIGSIGIIVDAAAQRNWQPVALNAAWLALAAYGILGVAARV